MALNELIKTERRRSKESQVKFAKALDIPIDRYMAIEKGYGRMTLDELTAILTKLSIKLVAITDSNYII